MEEYILKVLSIIGLSAFKYVVGFVAALTTGFSFIEILIYNVVGGMIGVVIYIYLWQIITKIYRKFVPEKKKKEGLRVSNFKRFVVKIVLKYELYGIAFLTPILLSVPVGTLIATALEPDKWRIKRFMFVSFAGWTLLLYVIYSFFDKRVVEII